MRTIALFLITLTGAVLSGPLTARAAGTLTTSTSGASPARIVDHHVEVLIDNGFVRTEVTQRFENPNPQPIDVVYEMPLPERAALSEVTIATGDRTLYGEVVPRDEAQSIHDAQQQSGGQSALAVKEGYQRFELHVGALPAGEQTTATFVYYETVTQQDGFGRYLYPLEEGGTDEGSAFWSRNDQVDGTFSAHVSLRSAVPIEEVRVPDFESVAEVEDDDPRSIEIDLRAMRDLGSDLVVYYRLAADLPGRAELVPFRDPSAEAPGTFMLVLTPGIDLEPLTSGSDHVLVLDVSGSMQGKLETLKAAAIDVLRSLEPGDRFRVIAFSGTATDITDGFVPVSDDSLEMYIARIGALQIGSATNLFGALELATQSLDADRASAILLVTDAVANEGLVDGPSFASLLREHDARVYGFLMGNSGNWPLMQLITEVSGGFYAQVSNADDIAGQMMLARGQMTHEALHDFEVSFDGGGVQDLTHIASKVHRGQQVVLFGHYGEPGSVHVSVDATITGQRHHYDGQLELPDSALLNPELERLWAFARTHELEQRSAMGLTDPAVASAEIEALGVRYQLVTDETSMIVLSDADFERLGIDPANRERSAREQQAQMLRGAGMPVDYSVPFDPAFTGSSGGGSYGGSSYGGSGFGGGALGADDAASLLLLAWLASRRAKRSAA